MQPRAATNLKLDWMTKKMKTTVMMLPKSTEETCLQTFAHHKLATWREGVTNPAKLPCVHNIRAVTCYLCAADNPGHWSTLVWNWLEENLMPKFQGFNAHDSLAMACLGEGDGEATCLLSQFLWCRTAKESDATNAVLVKCLLLSRNLLLRQLLYQTHETNRASCETRNMTDQEKQLLK